MLVRVLDNFQRLFAAIGLKDFELQLLQHVDNQHAHDGIVFDDKDSGSVGVHDGGLRRVDGLFGRSKSPALLHE
ncbi:hypothetical protein D3C80_1876110 [compost metagenome]